jgi:DNA-binding GntR family transcriptional regulator
LQVRALQNGEVCFGRTGGAILMGQTVKAEKGPTMAMEAIEPAAKDLPGATHMNLDERIYDRVKIMIAEGLLLPGERIVPEQLARSMGVSRTPILAALKRLSQAHIVEWRSRHGVFVRRISRRELAMIYELRELLEGLSARRAATLISATQVDYLRELFSDLDLEDTLPNRRLYMRRDYIFHSTLLEIAASPPLMQTMSSLNILVSAFSGTGVIRPMRESMAEHAAILDALSHHDADAAEAAMRKHLNPTVKLIYQEAEALNSGGG